jgi:hypothetical protein
MLQGRYMPAALCLPNEVALMQNVRNQCEGPLLAFDCNISIEWELDKVNEVWEPWALLGTESTGSQLLTCNESTSLNLCHLYVLLGWQSTNQRHVVLTWLVTWLARRTVSTEAVATQQAGHIKFHHFLPILMNCGISNKVFTPKTVTISCRH